MLAGSTQGFADGYGDQAKFFKPYGICWNPHDECLCLCDNGNRAIRRITLQGSLISTSFLLLTFYYCHLLIVAQDKSARLHAKDYCRTHWE